MAKQTSKREFVGIKLPPDLIEKIDAAAEIEGRSRSNMMERILLRWMKDHVPDSGLPEEPDENNPLVIEDDQPEA